MFVCKKKYLFTIVIAMVSFGCTSARQVPGQVYSNESYKTFGDEYEKTPSNKLLKSSVIHKTEKISRRFRSEVGEFFTSEESRSTYIDGTLGMYQ